MRIKHYLIMLICLLISQILPAQQVVQKVSKIVERTFEENIKQVLVRGEKANIEVFGWDEDYVKVTLTPISRNASQKKAINDLNYIKYLCYIENHNLIIKNLFQGKNHRITSNLSINILILIPKYKEISITNLYGPVSCSHLEKVKVDIAFGKLDMKYIHGVTDIKIRYTNAELSDIEGTLDINSEKSDINIKQLKAVTKLDCNYGNISIIKPHRDTGLTADGYHSSFLIETDKYQQFNYKLKTDKASIYFPIELEKRTELFEKRYTDNNKTIEIETSYSDITITSIKES